MDDGSEFTSRKFLDWCIEHKIEMMHISSGKPIEKRHCDSFYGRLREEFLNFPEFGHLFQARQPERGWMMDYDIAAWVTKPHGVFRNPRHPSHVSASRQDCSAGIEGNQTQC